MAKLSEKIGYALGDAAAGGITWKVMSIAFPFFFTNVFGLTVADAAALMLVARLIGPGSCSAPFRWASSSPCCCSPRTWAPPANAFGPMACTC